MILTFHGTSLPRGKDHLISIEYGPELLRKKSLKNGIAELNRFLVQWGNSNFAVPGLPILWNFFTVSLKCTLSISQSPCPLAGKVP